MCVHVDLASRELMQAGLWQSSCPSARLIMQERHSRPPFILPGGEAVPACSAYHMALAPLLSSYVRSLSTGGGEGGGGGAAHGSGGGGGEEVVRCWWNATTRFPSIICILVEKQK